LSSKGAKDKAYNPELQNGTAAHRLSEELERPERKSSVAMTDDAISVHAQRAEFLHGLHPELLQMLTVG
jgi:hypothetical protein